MSSKPEKQQAFAADLDNQDLQPEDSVGGARIGIAGIHHNVVLKTLEFKTFKDKKIPGKESKAAEFIFENADGETHRELIFEPPTDPAEITWQSDKYTKVDGKSVKTGKVSNEDMVKLLNNDIVYFLLDLAEALGYNYDKAKLTLSKATSFKNLIELFNKNYPTNDKKKLSIKLLWDNNDKKRTSYLRLKSLLSYYPFRSDLFDIYSPDRKTLLFINDFESKNKMAPKYNGSSAAAPQGTDVKTSGTTSGTSYSKPTTTAAKDEEDPF